MKLNLFVIACRQITTSSTRSATAVAPGGGWLFPTRLWSALDYLIPWEGRNAVCCDFSFYRLLLLFCAMYISRAVTVVLSFPELSFPSSPAFCLLEMWSRDCLCSVSMKGTVCWRYPFMLIHRQGTSLTAPPEELCLLVLSCPALQFCSSPVIHSCIGQNGDHQCSNYTCIVSTFSLFPLFS